MSKRASGWRKTPGAGAVATGLVILTAIAAALITARIFLVHFVAPGS